MLGMQLVHLIPLHIDRWQSPLLKPSLNPERSYPKSNLGQGDPFKMLATLLGPVFVFELDFHITLMAGRVV